MKLEYLDRSNYLKGLLILSKKDNYLAPEEREIIKQKAKELNFEERFVNGALSDLMENKHLSEEPVLFSSKEIARRFLKDAIMLAISDKVFHRREISYLRAVANANGISDMEYKELLRNCGQEGVKIESLEGIEYTHTAAANTNPT